MRLTDILPSGQFVTIVGSVALAGGFVFAANYITHPQASSASLAAGSATTQSADWQKSLDDIQAQSPLNRLPQAPSKTSVDTLLSAATSDNVTDTVARTLFINISNAKAQGLGNDIPTQDALIADAVTKINQDQGAPAYSQADLTITSDTSDALKAYGNAVMDAVQNHPKASYNMVMYTIGTSTDNNDPKRLAPLAGIGADYAALAKDLSHIPTPSTLAPIDLRVVNNITQIGKTFPDMEVLYSDPLRALAGLQVFDALNQETLRLFINIAQELSQKGILFNKDEPGSAWNILVP